MGLYRRNKIWWMRFTYNGKQEMKSTGTKNKALAKKIEAKVLTQIAEGRWLDVDESERRTFEELANKYEQQVFKEQKNWKSVQSYLNQLKEFFGPYTLSRITPALIDDFKQMRKTKGVKPATINRQLNILKRMLNLARKRWEWMKEVPIIEMEPNADTKRVRYLSFEEYHRLLDCCEEWLKGIVTVAAWTGLRQGNILNLRRDQVNLFAQTITIDGSETKNGENLTLPLSKQALKALKAAMRVLHIKSPYVFCQNDGKPFHKRLAQRTIKKALGSAEIEDFRFHDLRHCFASWNRQAGVDIDTLADLMGHKDARMTRRYAHVGPVHLANAVRLLDESYKRNSTKVAQSK